MPGRVCQNLGFIFSFNLGHFPTPTVISFPAPGNRADPSPSSISIPKFGIRSLPHLTTEHFRSCLPRAEQGKVSSHINTSFATHSVQPFPCSPIQPSIHSSAQAPGRFHFLPFFLKQRRTLHVLQAPQQQTLHTVAKEKTSLFPFPPPSLTS